LRAPAGNPPAHLRKLEDAEYIVMTKTHHGRTPTALLRLSRRGRPAFDEYTAAVRTLLDPAASEETP
jgi:hypothetical protein